MRKWQLLVLCGIAMVFYGCATIQYSDDVVQYDSPERVLEAQREHRNHIVICNIAMVVYDCTTLHYSYNGIQYDSSEKALEAVDKFWNPIIATINPTQKILAYRAIIVLPTQSVIEEHWIRSRGSRRDEMINYLVQMTTRELDKMAEAVRQKRLFNEVSITKSNNPDRYRTSDDTLTIYPTIDKKAFKEQWFVKYASKHDAFPIYYDSSLSPGRARLVSWLDYLERKVVQELGR